MLEQFKKTDDLNDVFAKSFEYLGSQVLVYKDTDENEKGEDVPAIKIIYQGFPMTVALTLSKKTDNDGVEWVNKLFDNLNNDKVKKIIEDSIPEEVLEEFKRIKLRACGSLKN